MTANNTKKIINYVTFKANQHIRTNGLKMTEAEAKEWVGHQLKNQTTLAKNWIKEIIAAGA